MATNRSHLSVLDGWRALSILLVLAAHMLPLGPKWLQMNDAVAPMGMALFFTLSGFLITRLLLTVDVRSFLIRRFFRIIPLAWLATLIVLPLEHADLPTYTAHLLFYGNLPPFWLLPITAHLWSLCVEMQFYVGIAVIVAVLGRRGLYLIPVTAGLITLLRILTETEISIVTWLRADEILAGGIVALAFTGHFGEWPVKIARRLNVYVFIPLFFLSCHPALGPAAYLRPYAASMLVFVSLVDTPDLLRRVSEHWVTQWLAATSYALYVVHGVLLNTWLGEGDLFIKYLKRPLLIGLTFLIAHLSTYRWEQPWIRFAKQITTKRPADEIQAISPGEA
jgi:peptidoglycan/LPS O-acetylase OafA/YrhL